MERKFTDAKKIIKKNGPEISCLIQKLESLEQSNKMLEDENAKLKSETITFKSVSNQCSQSNSSTFSSSLKSSTLHFFKDSNHQTTQQKVPLVSSPSYSNARKPFPPSSETKDCLPFKPFLPTEAPEKQLPQFRNFALGKPFAPAQDGNNNPAAETENTEFFNKTEFVDVQYSTRDAINKSPV